MPSVLLQGMQKGILPLLLKRLWGASGLRYKSSWRVGTTRLLRGKRVPESIYHSPVKSADLFNHKLEYYDH